MRVIDLVELERQGEITLGRGKVISAKTLAQFPGEYPVYSSSTKGEGVFGRYGQYDFDEEQYAIVGRKTKNMYQLGDEVYISVKNADLVKRHLDFNLIGKKERID